MSYLAERARRAELTEAVTKTAVRYPHLSASAIGRMFGVGLVEVSGVLQAANLDRPRRNSGDEFTAESVAADLAAGLSLKAIAQKFGEPEGAVRMLTLAKRPMSQQMPKEDAPVIQPETPAVEQPAEGRLDLSQYSRRRRTEMPTREQIAAALAAEPTQSTAAKRLGIGYSTLLRLVKEHGLTQPRGGPVGTRPLKPPPPSFAGSVAAAEEPSAPVHHPLICYQPKAIKGTVARVRILAMAGVMVDDGKYDVELIIREVQA